MDVVEVLIAIRCAGKDCGRIFYRCQADYRGEIYCEGGCRRGAARASKARHEASWEGRRDHAAHNVVYRARRRMAKAQSMIVRDTRSDNLPAGASSCARDEAFASAVEVHAVVAGDGDNGTIDSDDAASAARDAATRNDGEGRSDAGHLGPDDGEPPARCGDADGGARAVAPAGSLCCVVCGRRGLFIRDADDRRPRLRNTDRSLSGPNASSASRRRSTGPMSARLPSAAARARSGSSSCCSRTRARCGPSSSSI